MNRIVLPTVLVAIVVATKAYSFGSFEHIWLGDGPMLQFPDDNHPDGNQLFSDDYPYRQYLEPVAKVFEVSELSPQYLKIGELKFSVGEIVAIAGDYFTIVGSTISDALGNRALTRRERFLYAFSAFIENDLKKTDAPFQQTILPPGLINQTQSFTMDFIGHLEKFGHYVPWEDRRYFQSTPNPFKPRQSLAQLREIFGLEFLSLLESRTESSDHLRQLVSKLKSVTMEKIDTLKALATSLLSQITPETIFLNEFQDVHTKLVANKTLWTLIKETFNWNVPPYYSQILQENVDHFGNHAIEVYKTGHQLALSTAINAGKETDVNEKRKWLNIAYALDAFALHFLSDQFSAGHMRTPRNEILYSSYLSTTGGLAANAMHDEDGYYGLYVKNAQGQTWKAYGDYSYFSNRSKQNRTEIQRCLEASLDEVFEAFLSGRNDKNFKALTLVPKLTENNFSPLFLYDERSQQVLVRDSYDDIEATTFSQPSAAAWLYSWTFKPHYKKSSFDIRWLLNDSKLNDSATIELVCEDDSQTRFALPFLSALIDLDSKESVIQKIKSKILGVSGKFAVLSDEKLSHAINTCHSLPGFGKSTIKAFLVGQNRGLQELEQLVVYDSNGRPAPQNFPLDIN